MDAKQEFHLHATNEEGFSVQVTNQVYPGEPTILKVNVIKNNEVVGWCEAQQRSDQPNHQATIYEVYVLPDFRSRGVGRTLMLEMDRALREIGVVVSTVHIAEKNTLVVGFYKKQGFRFAMFTSEGQWLSKFV